MTFARSLLTLSILAASAPAMAQQPGPAPRQGPPPQARGEAPGGRRMAPPPAGPDGGQMGPGGPGMMGGPMAPGGGLASMLLAHSAELKLTDQQLSKLAAIARHTEERHRALRASMDSVMRANRPQPGVTAPADPRPQMTDQTRAAMDRMREQERADLRDALAVLTIDQQADAWMLRGPGPMGADGPPRARFGAVRGRRAGE